MKILIVSGIWPPDVGGPASHGPELGGFLMERGHDVRAVASCGAAGATQVEFSLTTTRRDRPRPLRIAGGAATVARAAHPVDVMYTTGMYSRSTFAAALNRRPLVLKLASDPAYERARNLGLYDGTLEAFQSANGDRRLATLKRVRSTVVARATHLIIPSRYLADIAARSWSLDPGRVTVVPNPAPSIAAAPDRAALRERLGVAGPTFVFGGRLVLQKNVPMAVYALAQVPHARLVIVGDGVERPAVERAIDDLGVRDRVTLVGAQSRAQTVEWVQAADATLLPSDWENFPHAVVESLAVGTPVIATAVGGVPEIIEPGVTGHLVEPRDVAAMAGWMRAISAAPEAMRAAAFEAGGRYGVERAFGAIEERLVAAAVTRPRLRRAVRPQPTRARP